MEDTGAWAGEMWILTSVCDAGQRERERETETERGGEREGEREILLHGLRGLILNGDTELPEGHFRTEMR